MNVHEVFQFFFKQLTTDGGHSPDINFGLKIIVFPVTVSLHRKTLIEYIR